MGLHVVHLELQLLFVRPVVIAVAHGDILALRPRIIKIALHIILALRILVLCLIIRLDQIRILLFIVPDDRLGTVCRSVVIDQDLKGKIRFLHQEAVQSSGDIGLVVEGDTAYADQGCSHRSLPLRLP